MTFLSNWDKASIEACEKYYIAIRKACDKPIDDAEELKFLVQYLLDFYGVDGVVWFILHRKD